MSETRFPLDAEQIVRLVAWAVARHVDAVRLPADAALDARPLEPVSADAFIVELGELIGVPVQHFRRANGEARLLPYEAPTRDRPTASSPLPARGAGDAA